MGVRYDCYQGVAIAVMRQRRREPMLVASTRSWHNTTADCHTIESSCCIHRTVQASSKLHVTVLHIICGSVHSSRAHILSGRGGTHRLLGRDDLPGVLAHKLAWAHVAAAAQAPAPLLACSASQPHKRCTLPFQMSSVHAVQMCAGEPVLLEEHRPQPCAFLSAGCQYKGRMQVSGAQNSATRGTMLEHMSWLRVRASACLHRLLPTAEGVGAKHAESNTHMPGQAPNDCSA